MGVVQSIQVVKGVVPSKSPELHIRAMELRPAMMIALQGIYEYSLVELLWFYLLLRSDGQNSENCDPCQFNPFQKNLSRAGSRHSLHQLNPAMFWCI